MQDVSVPNFDAMEVFLNEIPQVKRHTRMEPPPPRQHILRRLRDPLERPGFRSCGGQRALVSTPSVGPWRIVAADRPGHPHLHLPHTADTDADTDQSFQLLTLLRVAYRFRRPRGRSAHIDVARI